MSVAPMLQNFEDRSLEETEWQELGAREAAWKLAKNVFKLKEHEKAAFFSSPENRCHLASSLKPEEREFVVDSGASMHMISKKDLSEAEMDTLTKSCSPTIVITANGEVQTQEEAIVYVKELDMFLTMKVLENTPAVLSLGKLCDENGYSYEWINGQKPHLIKNGIRIICNTENFVPIVVPGLSSSSSGSSSTSRTLMRQESHSSSSSSSSPSSPTVGDLSVREREDVTNSDISPVPVSKLVDDSSGRLDEDQANKIPKTNKIETTTARGDPLCSDNSEIPEWLQEFRENLVDDEIPLQGGSHASSSREASLEPTPKRREDLRKHNVHTHFPKDRNCEICKRTKITRAPCRRRKGEAVLRADDFGDLITADHKVLSDSCESRNNHRYAVVVQDLATQWIQAYPCKNKTSQETQRSLQKFLEPERKPKVIYTDNSLEFGKACEDLSWNHCTSTPHRSETKVIAEREVCRVKEGTSAVLLQSGLNESWSSDSMECYTYLRNVTDLLSDGKTPYERRFGKPFEGPVIPFGSLVEYHPITAKDQSRIHQFGKKVLPGLFLGYALYAVGSEKLPFPQNLRISSWSYDMAGHAKKCVERYCELANKTTEQLYKVSTPCIDDHHFKEETKSVGELSNTCSQIGLKCLYLARIGRPDDLWSVNKLARSITKWTKACDKRLNRLISYIHHTSEYKQYCHVGNTAKQCRLGLFQDSDFAGDLEDSKSTSGGTLCLFGSHTFVPISWMCKKQTSVSHSSTESEIISLDTGLRLDGLPALELWDLIISVLGNVSHVSDNPGRPVIDAHKRQKSQSRIDVMKDIDLVPSNVQSANHEALLYVFEDNEAVIKMIMKGRSPTMRHVSRTHRVALDWLFDRINLDPKIQIKYIDTKNQLADILTKGSFTRDEWNHLLTLFNISHFSSTACIAAMAKRAQQDSGEGRVTAKSRPLMNLTARTPSIVSSSASTNPGRTSYGHHEPEQPVLDDSAGRPAAKSRSNYSQEYGSSQSSQVWKSGNGEHDRSGRPEQNSWDSLEKVDPFREEHLLGRTAHSARNEETIHERTGRPDSEDTQGEANFEKFIMGNDTTEFVNKVKNQVRIRQKRMSNVAEDCTEHSITWGMFMATTLNAVTFMGKSYSTMRNVVQNEEKITLKQMFDITAQTINNDEEVYCLDKIEYQRNTWTQLSLINDPVVIGLQSAKVYVFSDSVLCLGKVLQHPECNQAWKDRVAGVRAEKDYSDFDDIKGESAEFEWNIFPGFTTLQLCDKINNLLSSLGQTPETFTGRILFMSMFNDISCEGKDNKQQCLRDADFVKTFAKRFGIGQWSFIGPGSEKKWYPSENSPQGEWDRIAEDMLLEFAKSGHPIFRATTPLSRGKLKSKGKGLVSIHFSAEPDTIDSIYRIILSANQLSIYGAVAAICDEFVGQPDNTGEPVVLEGQSIFSWRS